MTRYEALIEKGIEYFGSRICNEMDVLETEDKSFCDMCPMNGRCWTEHNGWVDWLSEEVRDA